jgi:uncharacterized damage-inducible protein DinB
MSLNTIPRPGPDEHVPYYQRYVALVPDGDVIAHLERQIVGTSRLLAPIDETLALYRYAEGKWSVKEVLGHVVDAERIFAYRALRIARGDQTPLAGFDENAYVPAGRFDMRPIRSLLDEYSAARRSTVAFLHGLDAEAAARRGIANQHPISVRALAWITAGHELHHVAILKERYGLTG